MVTFLTTPLFRYLLFPLMSACLGIIIKLVSVHDSYYKFKKEDLAVGLPLMQTACLAFVLQITDKALSLKALNAELLALLSTTPIDQAAASKLQARAQQLSDELASSGWRIALMVLGLWAVSTIVRKWGWKSEGVHTIGPGIVLPFVMGFLALLIVMAGVQ